MPARELSPAARVELLDEWGVSAGVLSQPSEFSGTSRITNSQRHTRAPTSNWIDDFASSVRSRVIPIAHIALQDVDSALAELKRCIKLGFKGIFLAPENVGARRFSHPDFDPIWRECEDAGIPACLHVIVRFNRAPGRIGQFYQPREFHAVLRFRSADRAGGAPRMMVASVCSIASRGSRSCAVEAGCWLGALYHGQDGSEV